MEILEVWDNQDLKDLKVGLVHKDHKV